MVTYENGDSWAKKLKVGAREEYDTPTRRTTTRT